MGAQELGARTEPGGGDSVSVRAAGDAPPVGTRLQTARADDGTGFLGEPGGVAMRRTLVATGLALAVTGCHARALRPRSQSLGGEPTKNEVSDVPVRGFPIHVEYVDRAGNERP